MRRCYTDNSIYLYDAARELRDEIVLEIEIPAPLDHASLIRQQTSTAALLI